MSTTKVIDNLQTGKTPIKLKTFISAHGGQESSVRHPSEFATITRLGTYDNVDILLCVNGEGTQFLYLGKFNDGVVG